MHVTRSHLLSLYALIATAAGQINLLDYATDGVGNILGTYFGTAGTNATYDYVIVGGGNAGLAIATRLAEDPSISVAVIEAGGFYETDNGNRSVVPGYANYFTGSDPENYQPLIDWGFSTVPQPVCTHIYSTTHKDQGLTEPLYAVHGKPHRALCARENVGRLFSPELYDLSPVSLR